MQTKTKGKLYVVATPIGNLKDITLRAIDVLQSVDKIAAEDTRVARKLLTHYAIEKPLVSLHEHNERQNSQQLIKEMQQGLTIALLSDAGTPLISDPGYHLVNLARQKDLLVIPIPGPCAAITALSASGLPVNEFLFVGFLPAKSAARKAQLHELLMQRGTLIFYESPQRLKSSLADMVEVFGADRQSCVSRELTKLHESFISGSLEKVLHHYQHHPDEIRGEIVILIAGSSRTALSAATMEEEKAQEILELLLADLPMRKAVSIACKITGLKKNMLYAKGLQILNK